MKIFNIVATSGVEGLDFYDEYNPKFTRGDKFRVIEGPLKGAEGYVVRIKKIINFMWVSRGCVLLRQDIFLKHTCKNRIEYIEMSDIKQVVLTRKSTSPVTEY